MIASTFRVMVYTALLIVGVLGLLLIVGYAKFCFEEPRTRTIVDKLVAIHLGASIDDVLREINDAHALGVKNGPREVIVSIRSFALPFDEVNMITYKFNVKGKLTNTRLDQFNDGI